MFCVFKLRSAISKLFTVTKRGIKTITIEFLMIKIIQNKNKIFLL